MDAPAYVTRASFAASHQPGCKPDLPAVAAVPAKDPIDDAANKSLVKLLARKPAVLNAIESQSRALGRDFRILGATERLGLHERDWQRRAYAIRKEACGR